MPPPPVTGGSRPPGAEGLACGRHGASRPRPPSGEIALGLCGPPIPVIASRNRNPPRVVRSAGSRMRAVRIAAVHADDTRLAIVTTLRGRHRNHDWAPPPVDERPAVVTAAVGREPLTPDAA